MARMFGDRIKQLVMSADIMDEQTFEDLMTVIEKYVADELDVIFLAILEEQPIDTGRGLQTIRSTRDERPSYTIGNAEDGYSGHVALCFAENKPLWVVDADGGALKDSPAPRDCWDPPVQELPPYNSRATDPVYTSIMMPLLRGEEPFGVVEFATGRYLEPTQAAIDEMRTLAWVIARAFSMRHASNAQRTSTRGALKMLKDDRDGDSWGSLALPQIFVASSSRADEQVVNAIREVLGEYLGRLQSTYWADIAESGNINQQVLGAISASDFGLCYFSEPSPEGAEAPYADNHNVVFEAGMLQALTNAPRAQPTGWIPVREKESLRAPFDFASERILEVPRADEKFQTDPFKESLRARVRSLLGVEAEEAATEEAAAAERKSAPRKSPARKSAPRKTSAKRKRPAKKSD